jgi:hypothetical protein
MMGATYVPSQLFHWIRTQSHAGHLPHTCWVTRLRRITQNHFVASHVQQLHRHVMQVPFDDRLLLSGVERERVIGDNGRDIVAKSESGVVSFQFQFEQRKCKTLSRKQPNDDMPYDGHGDRDIFQCSTIHFYYIMTTTINTCRLCRGTISTKYSTNEYSSSS